MAHPELLIRLTNGKAGMARKMIWVEWLPDQKKLRVRWHGGEFQHEDGWIRTNSPKVALDWTRALVDNDPAGGPWYDWSQTD